MMDLFTYRRARPYVLVLLIAAVALPACDSASTPSVAPQIELATPISDLAAEVGQEAAVVDLKGHFSGNVEAGELSFSARSDNKQVAEVVQTGSLITVAFYEAGDAMVSVTASGAGATAKDTFLVQVSRLGPPGPAEGESDFLPISAGTVWLYNYSYDHWCPMPRTTRVGTLTMTFQSETLEGDVRKVTGEAHTVYRQVIEYQNPSNLDTTYVDIVEPFVAVETPEGVLIESDGLAGSFTSFGRLQRYYPATEDVISSFLSTVYRRVHQRSETPPTIGTTSGSCRSSPRITFSVQ